MAATSETVNAPEIVNIPAWPFLVANHELGRVDYRTLVAPDFLGDQGCSQILTTLPVEQENDGIHSCYVTYRSSTGETCKLAALYQTRTIPPDTYFPIRPQREVQVIVGLIFTLRFPHLRVTPELLEESFALYEDDYRQFCSSLQPRDFPVILSWPLSASLSSPLVVNLMPEQNTTRLQPRTYPQRPARVIPQQHAERAFPIARSQVLEQITQETFLTRLRSLFTWRHRFRRKDAPFS